MVFLSSRVFSSVSILLGWMELIGSLRLLGGLALYY
jgi:hypothetical protein